MEDDDGPSARLLPEGSDVSVKSSANANANNTTASLSSSSSGGKIKLGTPFNLVIIGVFSFAYTFGLANSAAVVWYFNSFGMSLVYLLTARLIGSFLTTYTQVAVGYFGDRLLFNGRFGRRKPFVVFGFLLQVVCLFFLATPPGEATSYSESTQRKLFYWLIGWNTLFNIGSYVMYNPLSSWLIESSADEEDYVTITAMPVNVGSILGGVCGLYATLFLQHITFAIIWACMGVPIMLVLVIMVPNHVSRSCSNQPDLLPSIRICMQNKEFMILFYNKTILYSAIDIGVSMISFLLIFSLPYIKHNSQIVPFGIYIFIASISLGMAANLIVKFVLKRFDKLHVYRWLTLAATFISVSLLPLSFVNSEVGLYAFEVITVILGGLIASPLYLINQYFTRDVIIYDTFKTHLRRENMYQLALNLPSGLIESLLSSVPLTLLYATGFATNPNYTDDDRIDSRYIWNEGSIWQMRIYSSCVVAGLCLLSNYTMSKYPLDESLTNSVNEKLKLRNTKELEQEEREMVKEKEKERVTKIRDIDYYILGEEEGTQLHSDDDNRDSMVKKIEDPMFMRNFTDYELHTLLIAKNMNHALFSIKRNILIYLLGGFACIVVLFMGLELQSRVNQTSFAILNVSLALLVSLQVCYEVLRLVAANRLSSGDLSADYIREVIELGNRSSGKVGSYEVVFDDIASETDMPDTKLGLGVGVDCLQNLQKEVNEGKEVLSESACSSGLRYFTFLAVILAYACISCTILVYPPVLSDDNY